MSTRVRAFVPFQFPPCCVVCLQPASKTYTVEKNITIGRGSTVLRVDVPMCAEHLTIANSKSAAERAMERFGLGLGLVCGLLVATALELHWIDTAQGNPLLNLPIALFTGASLGLILWAIHAFYLSPRLASRSVRDVRAAVKIRAYSPPNGWMDLEFSNPAAADSFLQANLDES